MNLEQYFFEKMKSIPQNSMCAIYPFGTGGYIVKKVLNTKLRIKEAIVVDNGKSSCYEKICALDEVTTPEKYIWIISAISKDIHDDVMKSLVGKVANENIIDLMPQKEMLNNFPESEYKVLSKIKSSINNNSCYEMIELIKKKKRERKKINVAEIGVACGATAIEVCRNLDKNDKYYCFDFESVVNDLVSDLKRAPYVSCEVHGMGNTRKVYDSYNWTLSEMFFEMRNNHENGIFDIVYLDAVHDFFHDGLACCILKKLIKPDGYLIFDDLNWCFGNNASCNPVSFPATEQWFTDEQIYDFQVQRVINVFMLDDKEWEEVFIRGMINQSRAVYHKK